MKPFPVHRALGKFGITSLVLAMAGCATAPAPIAPEAANRIHRVAVISSTAKLFTRQYVGLTVFGNEREEIDISDWKIDQQYEGQLAAELEKLPGLTVVKAPYSVEAFFHVNDLNGPWDAPAFWGPNWEAIGPATRSYCSENKLDALLVVAKAKTSDFLGGTNQVIGGTGIYVRGPGNQISVMHLISSVALLDCTNAKPLAIRTVATNQQALPGAIVRSAPPVNLPVNLSRTPIPQWSPEQRQHIKSELSTLPTSTWGTTLRSMFASSAKQP